MKEPRSLALVKNREAAPAKINLWLTVYGRRPDGYHLIDSLVAFAEFGDVLCGRPADATTLRIEGPEGAALVDDAKSTGSENLVLRAARVFCETFGGGAYAFSLEKCLPVASGMGGGSADAAAVLRFLASRRGIDLAAPELLKIALNLGADVPVCLSSRAARIGGIGECLTPVEGLDGFYVVAVNPRRRVATPRAFKALGAPRVRLGEVSPQPCRRPASKWLDAIRQAGNDLEVPVVGFVADVAEIKDLLAVEPGCHLARMSGSGATVFGLFSNLDMASRAAARISQSRPRWWVKSGRIF